MQSPLPQPVDLISFRGAAHADVHASKSSEGCDVAVPATTPQRLHQNGFERQFPSDVRDPARRTSHYYQDPFANDEYPEHSRGGSIVGFSTPSDRRDIDESDTRVVMATGRGEPPDTTVPSGDSAATDNAGSGAAEDPSPTVKPRQMAASSSASLATTKRRRRAGTSGSGDAAGTAQPPRADKCSSIVALNAAATLDGCDDQLLPASFRALEADLGFHPSMLGRISLAQALALAISCPFWGYLADRFSRKLIMTIGMVSWGCTTILLAFASTFWMIVTLRGFNGFFLGSVGPISQSILADITSEHSRGLQFGLIQMCASGGRIVGGVVTTSVSFLDLGGISGWRWTFLAVGISSCCLGLVVGLLLREFPRGSFGGRSPASASMYEPLGRAVPVTPYEMEEPAAGTSSEQPVRPASSAASDGIFDAGGPMFSSPTTAATRSPPPLAQGSSALDLTPPPVPLGRQTEAQPIADPRVVSDDWPALEDGLPAARRHNQPPRLRAAQRQSLVRFFWEVLVHSVAKPSVLLAMLEGIVGIVPWSAISFMTMFFQYAGLPDVHASIAAASLLLGAMISGPLGGYFGDKIFVFSPNHGRPFLGQVSMLLRIPLMLACFQLVPPHPESFPIFVTITFLVGLFSFAGVVVNRPLLSDIVRPDHRATAFAVTVGLEGVSGALFGAPLVGFLAERHFGYLKTELLVSDLPEAVRVTNARALSRALLCLTAIPWACSFVTYTLLHFTYRRDREKFEHELRELELRARHEEWLIRAGSAAGLPAVHLGGVC